MSLPADLRAQARLLATKASRRPKQASLRRSVSASYYALFHLLVSEATRRLISRSDGDELRNCLSRAFDHATMKTVARQFASRSISPKLKPGLNGQDLQDEIVSVAATFVDLQQHRHEADYDVGRVFTRPEVLDVISDAEVAFSDWKAVRNTVQGDAFLGRVHTTQPVFG